MRRALFSLWIVAALIASAGTACAQDNPRGTAKLMLRGKAVSVEYGRPSLKGRTAEQLVGPMPPGEVWRLGADQSTTFSTTGELSFGHVTIPAGEYSLWARKEAENRWSLVFNKQHGQWGTEHDAAQDLLAVPLEETKASDSAEQLTIALVKDGVGGTLSIQWGDMKLTAALWSQQNPRGTTKLMLDGKTISVEYGRPSLKGRAAGEMFARLKPVDVWRLGADQSTTISTTGELSFDHVTVPAGEYSLWARKEAEGKWSLVFNKQHGQWGTEHDAAQDLGSTPLKESKGAKSEEMVTISLAKEGDGGLLSVQWGDQVLSTSFKAK